MDKSKTTIREIKIEDLYINPDNYRYIEAVDSEILAIIAMFKVPNGKAEIEMFNLANDIAQNGLNPFEFPIVWYDEDIKKYIVIDGNRRITCIKLMTQYKDSNEIIEKIPSINRFYKMDIPSGIFNSINCLIYEDLNEAQNVLSKIHQDINDGIGRKSWDSYAKQRAKARDGNISKTFSVIEFVKRNPLVDESLVLDMNTKRWTSKLERVVSFADFKLEYNISFDSNNGIIYQDTPEQVFKMLSKLVFDIISNKATDNFRTTKDFKKYLDKLPNEYKTQVHDDKKEIDPLNDESFGSKDTNKTESNPDLKENEVKQEGIQNDSLENKESKDAPNSSMPQLIDPEPVEPRRITKQQTNDKVALRLSRQYFEAEYICLGEKGKEILTELESLNFYSFPYSAAALCRSIIEYCVKLWIEEYDEVFNGNQLATSYNMCMNILRNKKIIDDKQHKTLLTSVNKENFIDLLNGWIHSDSLLCVQPKTLENGWKANRLLIELYIKKHQKDA